MPELPEVETVCRALSKVIKNSRIKKIVISGRNQVAPKSQAGMPLPEVGMALQAKGSDLADSLAEAGYSAFAAKSLPNLP